MTDEPDVKGVVAGRYGDSKNVAQLAIDSRGRIIGAQNVAIDFPSTGGGGGSTGVSPVQSFGIQIGDGETDITVGYKDMYIAMFNGTITAWYAITVDGAMTRGSIRVNVHKIPFSDFPQPSAPMCGGGVIDNGNKGYGDASGWANREVKVGDVFIFDVAEASGVKKVLFQLEAVQA